MAMGIASANNAHLGMAEWENMNVLHDGKWPQILFYKRFVDPFLLWDGTVVALEEP